jgi:predicted ThiF/HesA family dinucleotide-utilizing enzyme
MKGTIKVDGKENRLVIENENGDEVAFAFINQCTDLKLASGHITVYDGHKIDPDDVIHVKSESGEEVGQIFMNQYEGVNFNFSDTAIDDMLDSDWDDDPY